MHAFERPTIRPLSLEDDPVALRLALESADVGVFELGERGDLRRFSERAATIWGLPAGTALGHEALLAMVHPDDRARLLQALALLLEQVAGSARIEFRLGHDLSGERWIELRGQRHAGGGTPPGSARVVGTLRDITERRRRTVQQQRSIDTLRGLIEQSPFGTYVLDARLRILYASREARRTLASGPQLIGTPIHDALRALWSEPVARRHLASFEHTLATGEPSGSSRSIEQRADTQAIEAYDWRIERITLPDGQFGLVCYFYDLTREVALEAEIEARERHLRVIADSAPVMLAHCGRDYRYRFVNHPYAQAFGLHPDRIVGLHLSDLIGEPAFERARPWMEQALAGREVQRDFVLPSMPSGRKIMRVALAPERDAANDVCGFVAAVLDVTEIRDTAAALSESQAQLAATFNVTSVGMAQTDPHSLRFLQVNDALCALTGYAERELLARCTHEILHPDDVERHRAALAMLADGRLECCEFDERYVRRDGVTVWVHTTFNPVRDAAGGALRNVAIVQDITARKAQELDLRDSRERLELALLGGGAGLFEWDAHSTDSVVSGILREHTNCDPASGRLTREEWAREVHPDDYATMQTLFAMTFDAREEHITYEFRMHTARGLRWLSGQARVQYDETGRPQRIYGVNVDITERKRAAEALADRNRQLHLLARIAQELILSERQEGELLGSLFDEIGETIGMESWLHYRVDEPDRGFLVLHAAGGVIEAERRALSHLRVGELMCGYVAETRDRLLVEDLHANPFPGSEAFAAAGMRSYIGFPLLVRGELLGTLAYVSRRQTSLRDGDVQLVQALCDQIAATLDRQRLLRRLEQSDRQKDRFLATLSHELRNPLAPIRTAAELLATPGIDAAKLQWARNVIQRQVAHVALLLDDLLDLARVTQSKLELRRSSVTLGEVVESAVEAARPLLDRKRHALHLALEPELPAFEADAVRLSQVVSNLLTNSAKYTDPGGHIELRGRLEPGDWLVIEVVDDGIGIAREHQGSLFDMFWQVQGAGGSAEGGLGIGLALVKGLMELHGGSVAAFSDGPGRGSTFTLRLPLVRSDVRPPSGAEAPAGDAEARPLRVLLADDNRDAADALGTLLRLSGYEVEVVHGGHDALSAAPRFKPDAVVLDIGMPDLDGYGVARLIRAEPWGADLRLVALTGWGREDDKRRARAAGFDAHLTKPIEIDQLEAALRSI